jgi:PAS domain S-box-containing protein
MNSFDPANRTQTTTNLSPRELDVVHLAHLGYSDKKIATALSISKLTVTNHWQNILIKSGALNRNLVIARYSAALARNEIDDALRKDLDVVAPSVPPRGSRVTKPNNRSMEKAIQGCQALSAKRLTSNDDVFRRYLQECVKLTDSASGCLAGIRQDADQNYYISTSATFNLDRGSSAPVVITGWNEVNPQPSDFGDWFDDVLQTKEAYVANEPSAEHAILSKSLRTSPIDAFVGIPIVKDRLLVGVLCLANRPGGYDEDVIQFLQPILSDCATFIEGWVSEVDRLALDRKIADVALMLNTVTDKLAGAFVYACPRGSVLHVNRMFLDIFGLGSGDENFLGQPMLSLMERCLPVVSNPGSFAGIIESLVSKGVSTFGHTVTLRDSRIFKLDCIGIRKGNTCTGLLWKFTDVTKLEYDQAALSEVFQQARDGIIVVTSNGEIQHWNKRAESIFGYGAGEAIGQTLAELIIPERYRDAHLEGLKRHRDTGDSRVMGQLVNIVGKRKCGAEVNVEMMLSCIDAGDHPRYCAYIREVMD